MNRGRAWCRVAVVVALSGWATSVRAQAGAEETSSREARPLLAPSSGAGERARGSGGGPSLTRTGGSLVGVLALAVGAAAVVRRVARRRGGLAAAMGPAGHAPSGIVEVLARYPVGRGAVLVLLRIGPRVLLLSQLGGSRGSSITTLAQFDDPEEVGDLIAQVREADGESLSGRFRAMLGQFGRAHDEAPGAARPTSSRRVTRSAAGDAVELIDPSGAEIPVVDLTIGTGRWRPGSRARRDGRSA